MARADKDKRLIRNIEIRMKEKPTEELLEIFKNHDIWEYTVDSFKVIKDILISRGVSIPKPIRLKNNEDLLAILKKQKIWPDEELPEILNNLDVKAFTDEVREEIKHTLISSEPVLSKKHSLALLFSTPTDNVDYESELQKVNDKDTFVAGCLLWVVCVPCAISSLAFIIFYLVKWEWMRWLRWYYVEIGIALIIFLSSIFFIIRHIIKTKSEKRRPVKIKGEKEKLIEESQRPEKAIADYGMMAVRFLSFLLYGLVRVIEGTILYILAYFIFKQFDNNEIPPIGSEAYIYFIVIWPFIAKFLSTGLQRIPIIGEIFSLTNTFASGILELDIQLREKNATNLHQASSAGNISSIESLLENGADINHKTSHGATPLHKAAEYGQNDAVKKLIDNGADIDAMDNKGRTPLYLSIESKEIETAIFIINHGADVNLANKKGLTPLIWASLEGQTDVVNSLISKGANVNAKDKDGFSPLFAAAQKNDVDVGKSLIKARAKVNIKTNDGSTPLYIAAQKGYREVVELLVSNGADIKYQREWGRGNIVAVAKKFGHDELAKYLESETKAFKEESKPQTGVSNTTSENDTLPVASENDKSPVTKIKCDSCGTLILPTTAKKTSGICMPCFKRRKKEKWLF